ncbi:BatD family protein [Rhizobium grahamii]|uniref:DUF7939 domain-containing protein n=1 Tax=Rhizobium grahamii CCGE 502 TaxID=990285 RepID=S3HGN4_9HYPH|nr:BatD family protein [Rhizobium grahamii]EPE98037.1 hypothetical protein RGCCGE502_14204 [Rhizobium grahamii CCGE 502]
MRIIWAILTFASMASAALAAEPFARVTIDDSDSIVPGQQVQVTVDVFAPNFFTSPPQFPLFDVPNALVTLPDERAQNITETIDGVQYSGIRRNYAIVPEIAGTFALPPAKIEFSYSDDGKFVRGTAQLPPTQFTVASPIGSDGTTLPFAARGVTITQSFDRDPAKLKAGEAIVRTVVVFAENTQAMMIPPLEIAQASGLQTYTQSPQLGDGVTRDRAVGSSRTETVTYVAAAAGSFQIPPITLDWFDTEAKSTKTASLPAVAVTVADAQPTAEGIAPQVQASDPAARVQQRSMRAIAVAVLLLIALGAVFMGIRYWFPPVQQWFARRQRMRAISEPQLFRRLIDAVKHGTPQDIYACFDGWCRAIGYRTGSAWATGCGDDDLSRRVQELDRLLYAPGSHNETLDRAALAAAITRNRMARVQPLHPARGHPLPELNP